MNIFDNIKKCFKLIGELLSNGGGHITGELVPFAGNVIPNGFLLCDGSAISRTTYKDLFNTIGTLYGSGDEETTFNLPDFRDKVIWGSNISGNILEAGLPNITGNSWQGQGTPSCCTLRTGTGAFSVSNAGSRIFAPGSNVNSGNFIYQDLNFDASQSNSIYGNSDTVQPPGITIKILIKY